MFISYGITIATLKRIVCVLTNVTNTVPEMHYNMDVLYKIRVT